MITLGVRTPIPLSHFDDGDLTLMGLFSSHCLLSALFHIFGWDVTPFSSGFY